MRKEVQIFENKELGISARTIVNDDGSISVNAEDTAIGFGWTQEKNRKIYVKWERINGYLEEFGFSPLVGKDDYIPESLFYRLGMKASNARADKFQNWQRVLEDTVNKTVINVLGGKDSDAYKEVGRKVFAECNRDLKHYFNVNARNNVPKNRFDDAVKYAKNWKPCTNTMMLIYNCNAQMSL